MRNLASLALVWFAIGAASAAMFGHFTKNMKWASWIDGATPMAISTAVVIVSLAGAILLHEHRGYRGGRHD